MDIYSNLVFLVETLVQSKMVCKYDIHFSARGQVLELFFLKELRAVFIDARLIFESRISIFFLMIFFGSRVLLRRK